MAKIIQFPRSSLIETIKVRDRERHSIRIRIVDERRPEEARWQMQFAIQNAAGYQALLGFTNEAARKQDWHKLVVRRKTLLMRFLRQAETLIATERVIVKVDGFSVVTRLKAA